MPKIFKFTILLFTLAVLLMECKPARPLRSATEKKIRHVAEDTFMRPDGWDIPALSELKAADSGSSHQRSAEGELIPINFTNYSPTEEILSFEPLDLVGYKFGEMKIQSVTTCDIRGHIFEYSVIAVNANAGKNSAKIEQTGSPFFYRYYDLDGDGIFETLITDSSDVPVPDWVRNAP